MGRSPSVLVTGASGFIGQRLCQALARGGDPGEPKHTMITATDIKNLLNWGDPEHHITTARGIRTVRKANIPAGSPFWAVWRNKAAARPAR